MRRRRFITSLVIIASALTGNAYVDYLLLVHNPAELELLVRKTLRLVVPDYRASFAPGSLEFSLGERTAVIRDLTFYEKGDDGRELFRVARLEAIVSLVPPAVSELTLVEPVVVVRVDREGRVNFETGGEVGSSPPELLSDLHVGVQDGRLRVINDFEGMDSDVLLTDVDADLRISRDLSVVGGGRARLGALFGQTDPRAGGGVSLPGLPDDRRFKDVFPEVAFKVRSPGSEGPVQAEVELGGGELTPQLRSLIPPHFVKTIWNELNPSGGRVDARLVSVLRSGEGVRVNAAIRPRGVTVKPAGFPIPITDVGGAFEVLVSLPEGRAEPELLSVAFEDVAGRVAGGVVQARGTVFPGREQELVSLFLAIKARGLELRPPLVAAFPPDIREVYQLFDPQGAIQEADVVIFKGPTMDEPQISVDVGRLAGSISAMYTDYPVRLSDVQGSFLLRQGANVEVQAEGTLSEGGRAAVEALVMHGDLIHVDVRGRDVPLGPGLVAALSPRTREFVQPFHPRDGTCDFRVLVAKAGPRAIVEPKVELELHDVEVQHDAFPYPVRASGQVAIEPVFPDGATAADDPDPERVDVRLDLRLSGEAVGGAGVRGQLRVPLGDAPFTGQLEARADRIDLDPSLLDAVPPELRELRRLLGPSGSVRELEARIGGVDDFELRGRGEELQIVPADFPVPLGVTAFDVARRGRVVHVRSAQGTTPEGGTFTAEGHVTPGEGADAEPLLDLAVRAEGVRVDPALVEAVPEPAARRFLADLRPSGRLDAAVNLRITPGLGAHHELVFDLRGVDVHVDRVAPALAGLDRDPVRRLAGRVRVEVPDRIELTGLRGQLMGADLALGGVVHTVPTAPPPATAVLGGGLPLLAAARAPTTPAMDLSLSLGGLRVDEETPGLLGPEARAALEAFPAEGPVDLALHLHRGPQDLDPRVHLRLEPKGLRVLPQFLPLPLEDARGTIELVDGEPVVVDVTAQLGQGRLRVRRDVQQEGAFPGGGAAGRVFRVTVDDFERPTDVAAFQEHLSPALRDLIDAFEPRGPVDVRADFYLPHDERRAIVWNAEVRPRALGLSAGLRFEDLRGVVRASGRVSEFERGAAEGELFLERLDWKKQTASSFRGPFRLEDGVFSVGVRGAPFVAQLYDGRLAGIVEFTTRTGYYRGWLELRDASMSRCVEELSELGTDDEEPEEKPEERRAARRPLTGRLFATLAFHGGGRGLDGRTLPFGGEGTLHVANSNLLLVPGLDWLRTIGDAIRGETTQPLAFETMDVEYRMTPDRVHLEAVRLDSRAVLLVQPVGREGWIRLSPDPEVNGQINLDLVPFSTGTGILDRILSENVVPLTGYSVRGKVWDPTVVTGLPFYGATEQLLRQMLGLDEEEEDQEETPRAEEED